MADWNEAPYWAAALLRHKESGKEVWAGSHLNNTLAVRALCEGRCSFTIERASDYELVEKRPFPAWSQARKWQEQGR